MTDQRSLNKTKSVPPDWHLSWLLMHSTGLRALGFVFLALCHFSSSASHRLSPLPPTCAPICLFLGMRSSPHHNTHGKIRDSLYIVSLLLSEIDDYKIHLVDLQGIHCWLDHCVLMLQEIDDKHLWGPTWDAMSIVKKSHGKLKIVELEILRVKARRRVARAAVSNPCMRFLS